MSSKLGVPREGFKQKGNCGRINRTKCFLFSSQQLRNDWLMSFRGRKVGVEF